MILPGQEDFLGNLYAFGALLSFTFAHASVARLRAKKKDVPRPYRGPGNVTIRGYDAPLFALVGGTFTFVAFVRDRGALSDGEQFGVGWLVLGVIIYIAYRRRQGLDLVSTHKVAIAQPVVDHEAEYDSVLVHFGDSGYDEQVLATARGSPRASAAASTCWSPSRCPTRWRSTRRCPIRRRPRRASSRRRKVSAAAACPATSSASAPGQAGRRIVEDAVEMRAAAIVMPLPRRIDGASLFGKTLETVLTERPCRVIIESVPDGRDGRRRLGRLPVGV